MIHPSEKKYRSGLSPKPLLMLSDPGPVDLTVVIPACNEIARLPSMLATNTIHHLDTRKSNRICTYEILIVDDGSGDGTSKLALELTTKYPERDIRIITLKK